MLFDKEELIANLEEKAISKIEMLRQEISRTMFGQLNEELFFVFDKKMEDVVGGPFSSKTKAQEYIKELDSKDLIIMTEKALAKKMGVTEFEKYFQA